MSTGYSSEDILALGNIIARQQDRLEALPSPGPHSELDESLCTFCGNTLDTYGVGACRSCCLTALRGWHALVSTIRREPLAGDDQQPATDPALIHILSRGSILPPESP